MDWLFCNLDLDEAVCFSSASVQDHFSAVPAQVSQIVYINHEAIVAEAEPSSQETWFEQIEHFKVSPVLKLPFIGRRFPSHDEEPQILDHPEGIGEKTLRFWQDHNARLSDQYNFKKRSGGSTCSYFDGYMRGKVAVRVQALGNAIPRVHRWHGSDLQTVVCHPGVASLLHYINCGGLDWFSAKYQIRGSEEANRLWFHVLAQERAKIGREALRELYNDVLSIPQQDLDTQISEGFVTPLRLNFAGETPCLSSTHQGFWGWAVVGLGDQLYVHMPLSAPSEARQTDTFETFLGEPMVHYLTPEQGMEVDLDTNNCEVPVFVAEIPKQRGCLVLDLLPSSESEICLAVGTAVPDKTAKPEWVAMSGWSSGWRCRIETSRWAESSSTVAIWIATATPGLSIPALSHTAVTFQELTIDSLPLGRKCSAHLVFEHEMSLLPPDLQLAYTTFYAAYERIDGRAIADEATHGSIELTYAEIEFAPFYQLLAKVAEPQPGLTSKPSKSSEHLHRSQPMMQSLSWQPNTPKDYAIFYISVFFIPFQRESVVFHWYKEADDHRHRSFIFISFHFVCELHIGVLEWGKQS